MMGLRDYHAERERRADSAGIGLSDLVSWPHSGRSPYTHEKKGSVS
jgi:hypothetical protein